MRLFRAILFPVLLVSSLLSTFSFAVQPDRISGTIDAGQAVMIKGSTSILAAQQFDQGRADGSQLMSGLSLVFKPSPAQQADLDSLLAQQQDPTSPNYHKWLTPAQFGARFGMSANDLKKVAIWLQSQGLTVTHVSNSRNQVFFEGTLAAVELAFHTEIHNYLVDGDLHYANATEPSVPAALAGTVLGVHNLHNFHPRARIKPRSIVSVQSDPHFTSHISGNHFLTPGDFATIYDTQGLTGIDGTSVSIAIVGQSAINLTDISNFRSAAGLPAKAPTITLMPGTGTSTVCSGDEGESDLDIEWAGGVAKNAAVIFVYPGLPTGKTCSTRTTGAFDALQYAVDNDVAPVISSSYGNCEAIVTLSSAQQIQGWAQQGNAQGQTIFSASGDSGAADCDYHVATAISGLAVDIPASIPEVTGAGGTEFMGDAAGVVTGSDAGTDLPYWGGTTGGVDSISSALEYIPEEAWNDSAFDIANGGFISASGGGASATGFFTKPSWQTGTGVPADGKRDVPDISLSASADHDGYVFCSEDGATVPSCSSGFRDSGSNLTVVGGTSAAAPTLAGIVALLNQYLGASGLGNINPALYKLAASNPTAFHDIALGTNIVPCTTGTTGCTTGSYGFSAGVGYDQVTGLGSINAGVLFAAWPASRAASSVTISSSSSAVNGGASVTFTATVTPTSGVGTVSFSTLNNGVTTALGAAVVNIPYQGSLTGVATFTTTALPSGTNNVTATYEGDAVNSGSTSSATTVIVSTPDFTLGTAPGSATVVAGHPAPAVTVTITPVNGFNQLLTFTCPSAPTGVSCAFNPATITPSGSAVTTSLTISTAASMTGLSAQSITVSAAGTSTTHTQAVTLTVNTPTDQSFTLAPTAATLSVAQGSPTSTTITMTPVNGFNTALTYTCTGQPSESTCTISPSTATTSAMVTLNVTTTAPTAMLRTPFGRGSRIFYAALLPGLFGIVFAAGSRKRSAYGMRVLGVIVVLGCSTLWLGACSNSSSGTKNPGTPTGTYTLTVSATTGGANPVTGTTTVQLTVTP
jgi:subtilase family serine protease